jgi:hypothetical protein
LFVGWGEDHENQGWLKAGEDMCRVLKKSGMLRDSAQNGLPISAGMFIYTNASPVFIYIYIYIYKNFKIFFFFLQTLISLKILVEERNVVINN